MSIHNTKFNFFSRFIKPNRKIDSSPFSHKALRLESLETRNLLCVGFGGETASALDFAFGRDDFVEFSAEDADFAPAISFDSFDVPLESALSSATDADGQGETPENNSDKQDDPAGEQSGDDQKPTDGDSDDQEPPAKPDDDTDGQEPPAKPDGDSDDQEPPAKPDGDSDDQEPPVKPDGDSDDQEPPVKPDGDSDNQEPPAKPDGDPGQGGGETGNYDLTGVLTVDGTTRVYPADGESTSLESTTGGENVVLVENGGTLELSGVALNKTGDCADSDATDFYAVNAVVASKSGSTVCVSDSTLDSNARGANGLFASGTDSVIYAKGVEITSANSSSRGVDATFGGTVVASDLTITTAGEHCAALATDRGNGYISVVDSTLSTAGTGSPLIYSTGVIEVANVSGEATGAQIVGMEGLNAVRIVNSDLTGSAKKASEPIANGVIIYQSMSGDASEGTANFEVSDSTLRSSISGGAMFYVTNTAANVVVRNTELDFDSDANYLLFVGGNDGSNNWGRAGANGADVVFTAIDQTLNGDVSCDGISSVELYLTQCSTLTGAIVENTDYTGDGGTTLRISADSTWVVTGDSTLKALSVAEGGTIVDANGATVTIKDSNGETLVEGASEYTITVGAYDATDYAESAGSITEFEVDRTAFDAYFSGDSEPEEESTVELSAVEIASTNGFQVGSTLVAVLDSDATATYQWYRGTDPNDVSTPIDGATNATYRPTAEDVGCLLKVVATGTGDYSGTVEATTGEIVPAPTLQPQDDRSVWFRQTPYQQVGFRQTPFQQVGFRQTPFQQVGFRQTPFQQAGFQQTPFQQAEFQRRETPTGSANRSQLGAVSRTSEIGTDVGGTNARISGGIETGETRNDVGRSPFDGFTDEENVAGVDSFFKTFGRNER